MHSSHLSVEKNHSVFYIYVACYSKIAVCQPVPLDPQGESSPLDARESEKRRRRGPRRRRRRRKIDFRRSSPSNCCRALGHDLSFSSSSWRAAPGGERAARARFLSTEGKIRRPTVGGVRDMRGTRMTHLCHPRLNPPKNRYSLH